MASPHHNSDGDRPWPHRLAVALCCAAFPLVWVGGLVTTYDAGMAVPDWPSTYGYNLLLYPWQTWVWGPFDLFIEHGHRLLAAAVGLLSMIFVAAVFRCDERRWMRVAAVGMFGLVLVQGLLGGLRVRMDERTLALLHACLGLATFAYAAAMAVITARYWRQDRGVGAGASQGDAQRGSASHLHRSLDAAAGRRLLRFAVVTAGLVYIQVIVGALLRHVPISATPMFFRVTVLFHIVLGFAVCAHVVLIALRGWKAAREVRRLQTAIGGMGLLVVVQLALGGATWVFKYGWPSWLAEAPFAAGFTIEAQGWWQSMIATLHVALGAWILALSVVVALRSWLFFRLAEVGMTPQKELQLRELQRKEPQRDSQRERPRPYVGPSPRGMLPAARRDRAAWAEVST